MLHAACKLVQSDGATSSHDLQVLQSGTQPRHEIGRSSQVMPEAIPVSRRPVLDQHTVHHALNRMDTLLAMRLEGLALHAQILCVKWKRKYLFARCLISYADQVGRRHYLMCLPAL